jgi:hypothetical protein
MVCALLANIHRKKGGAEVTFDAFMLKDKSEHQMLETRKALLWMRSVAKPR